MEEKYRGEDLPSTSLDLSSRDVVVLMVAELLGKDVVVVGATDLPGKDGVDEEAVGLLSEDVLAAGGASVRLMG